MGCLVFIVALATDQNVSDKSIGNQELIRRVFFFFFFFAVQNNGHAHGCVSSVHAIAYMILPR